MDERLASGFYIHEAKIICRAKIQGISFRNFNRFVWRYDSCVCWGRSLTLTFRFPSSPDTRTVDRCKALSVFNRTIIPSEVPQLPCHGNTLPHRENALHPLNV